MGSEMCIRDSGGPLRGGSVRAAGGEAEAALYAQGARHTRETNTLREAGGEAEAAHVAHEALWALASPIEQLNRLALARARADGALGASVSAPHARSALPPVRVAPTLIVHGTLDSIVPIESSELLLRALRALDDGGGHADTTAVDGGARAPKHGARGKAGPRAEHGGHSSGADGRMPQHAADAARREHTLVRVRGARHSFSWILCQATLAVHDIVVEWVMGPVRGHRSSR